MAETKRKWDEFLTPKHCADMQHALNWWHSMPIQDIKECKFGWANLLMKYYPSKSDCYHFTKEEVNYMYQQKHMENSKNILIGHDAGINLTNENNRLIVKTKTVDIDEIMSDNEYDLISQTIKGVLEVVAAAI